MGIVLSLLESIKIKNYRPKVLLVAMVAGMFAAVSGTTQQARAIDYNAAIQNLQTQNASNANSRAGLQSSAASLQDQINSLQASIDALNGQIAHNQAQQTDLQQKIAQTEAEITSEQNTLSDSVRKLYISNDMSMLEMMASSQNLSEYVDREQYTVSAQTSVKQHLDRINTLKAAEQQQKKQVDGLLADSTAMQGQLSSQKQQVDELLAMNQAQQAQYSATIARNNSQISSLQAQQAAENEAFLRQQAAAAKARAAASGAPVTQVTSASDIRSVNGSNYPYANAPWPNDIPDPWGMYQRQCVSYTAWAVTASGRHMPYWGGSGDAKQWGDNAIAAGIPVDGNPRAGDVAIKTAGTYGHAMYVNSVNSDGTINISQYNAAWTGTYSTATITTSGLVFIHFP